MYAFDYDKPADLAGALAALKAEDAKALAGGQSLIPTLKQRLAQPSTLVDLKGLPELQGVSVDAASVTIGAAARHAAVAEHAEVVKAIPALAALAGKIGDPQVRNRGSLGGSLANNDPSACYPSAALALGATIKTDRREIGADAFFQGLYETALEEDELIVSVSFPIPEAAGYAKFVQPASRFALTAVFVAKFAAGVRVAVTGAGESGVFRHAALEQALTASFAPQAVEGVAVSADGLIEDLHGTPAYRANLIKVMAGRATAEALG
ncbi:MAG: FAD binding domain-containing protein [Pseudomonadota bacterium]